MWVSFNVSFGERQTFNPLVSRNTCRYLFIRLTYLFVFAWMHRCLDMHVKIREQLVECGSAIARWQSRSAEELGNLVLGGWEYCAWNTRETLSGQIVYWIGRAEGREERGQMRKYCSGSRASPSLSVRLAHCWSHYFWEASSLGRKETYLTFITVWLRSLWSWVGPVWKKTVPLLLCSLRDRLSLIWLGNPQWESVFSFHYVSPA